MSKLLVFIVVLVVGLVVTVGVSRGDAWVGAFLLGWMLLRAVPGMWADLRSGWAVVRTLKFTGRRGLGRRSDLTV